jgi:hypothetical protein
VAPKRRDKQTKNDYFLLQKSARDVVESKIKGGLICGIGNQYLCGQQHKVSMLCIILLYEGKGEQTACIEILE